MGHPIPSTRCDIFVQFGHRDSRRLERMPCDIFRDRSGEVASIEAGVSERLQGQLVRGTFAEALDFFHCAPR